MMSTLHNIRLAIISASLLLPVAVSCGEIELPLPTDTPTQEKPSTPADDKDSDETPGDEGDSPEEKPSNSDEQGGNQGDDNGSQGNDNGNQGNDNGDQHFGRATLTADGHIVIDGTLYLSIIEYRDIKGEDAAKAQANSINYAEGALTGWRVPTLEDAKILTDVLTSETTWYGTSTMALLNHALEDSELTDYDLLPLREGDGTVSIYFLCDEGNMAYTFDAYASQQFASIKSTKKYRLRLVKDK